MSKIRIIGGVHKNRRIPILEREGLRPSPERVRETLFNWLQHFIHGARVLDAFAGSGAMGLEALSRGAAWVDFCDTDRHATRNIQTLLRQWHIEQARVLQQSALQFTPSAPYDLIILDPPFAANLYETLLNRIQDHWLKAHGYVYLEYPRAQSITLPESFSWYRHSTAGHIAYGLLQRTGASSCSKLQDNPENIPQVLP